MKNREAYRLTLTPGQSRDLERDLIHYSLAVGGSLTYFIASGAFVKVGVSRDVRRRLFTLRVASPDGANLIGLLEGGRSTEKRLHKRLERFHHRAEWYRLHPRLLGIMRAEGTWPYRNTGPSHLTYLNVESPLTPAFSP